MGLKLSFNQESLIPGITHAAPSPEEQAISARAALNPDIPATTGIKPESSRA